MDHQEKPLMTEEENQEPLVPPCEELSDDDLDNVAGGWDGSGGSSTNDTGGP